MKTTTLALVLLVLLLLLVLLFRAPGSTGSVASAPGASPGTTATTNSDHGRSTRGPCVTGTITNLSTGEVVHYSISDSTLLALDEGTVASVPPSAWFQCR